MKNLLLALTLLCLLPPAALAAVQGKEVSYTANGTTMKGWIAYDDAAKGKRPLPCWWCTSGGGTTPTQESARTCWPSWAMWRWRWTCSVTANRRTTRTMRGKFVAEVSRNKPVAKARFKAAMKLLRKQRNVDSTRLAAVGYCSEVR